MTDPLVASEEGLTGAEVMAQRNAFRNSFAADKWCCKTHASGFVAVLSLQYRYPWLQGETFDSVFVPITYQQGDSRLVHIACFCFEQSVISRQVPICNALQPLFYGKTRATQLVHRACSSSNSVVSIIFHIRHH